jgi:hypothetical protein
LQKVYPLNAWRMGFLDWWDDNFGVLIRLYYFHEENDMYTKEVLLEMLLSDKPPVRYEACEMIRASSKSSPEVISALLKALHDSNGEVAGRARAALHADVHHQMAIKMGIEKPETTFSEELDENNNNIIKGYSISPEIHIKLQKSMPLFAGIFILLFCLISLINKLAILIFLIFILLFMIASIIQFPPIKCIVSGCNGRMELTRTRVSPIIVNLYYYCKKCGETY